MKLAYRLIENAFELNEEHVNTLIVENQQLFTDVVKNIYRYIDKEDSDFTFSSDGEPLNISDKVWVISDFINLDFENKKIANSIIKCLINKMREKSDDFTPYFSKGFELLSALTFDMLANVDFDENVDYQGFLKLFKPAPVHSDDDLLLNLESFIDALIEFCNIKLFVLVNVKAYLNAENFYELFTHMRYMQTPLLCIESHETFRIDGEKLTLIDCDLCEIVL